MFSWTYIVACCLSVSLSLSGKASSRREDSTFLIVNLISDGCQAKHTPTFSTYERDKQYVIDHNDCCARATFNYYYYFLFSFGLVIRAEKQIFFSGSIFYFWCQNDILFDSPLPPAFISLCTFCVCVKWYLYHRYRSHLWFTYVFNFRKVGLHVIAVIYDKANHVNSSYHVIEPTVPVDIWHWGENSHINLGHRPIGPWVYCCKHFFHWYHIT